MRILLVNTYEKKGGAARAAGRVFGGLRKAGADVTLLVQNRETGDPSVITPDTLVFPFLLPLRPYLDFLVPQIQVRKRILFSTALIPDKIVRTIDRVDPSLVHLNWIAGGMIKIETLSKIGRPLVWTFHDLWAVTGGCHYPADGCLKYLDGCGACPLLHSGKQNDLSRKVFNRKQRVYEDIADLTVICPSRWLADQVKESPLLKGRRIEVIPNGLDTRIFKPTDKEQARFRFQLPKDKKIILFGGIRGSQNELKGFPYLLHALRTIPNKDLELVVFGSSRSGQLLDSPVPIRFMGFIPTEATLAELYAAADVVAVPSIQEVFGQTASEALSCGVPVAAFATGGLTGIVEHRKNGFLADARNAEDLGRAIEWILRDKDRYDMLSADARNSAVKRFDTGTVVSQILSLYKELSTGNNTFAAFESKS
jgi:glycosyltransferase involved in cell wall biosynthesis